MDGSNLPEVLNYLASSDRSCFDKIIKNITDIIDNVIDLKAPIIKGTQNTYIAMVEKSSPGIEYTWDNISFGTKEIVFQITLLNSSERGSLLIIEEPEIHLHSEAIRKFVSILKDIVETGDKQIIITTHSPVFIDLLQQENLFCVIKEDGKSKIIPLSQENAFESLLIKSGLSKSDLFISKSPSLIIIVEGRDDTILYHEFLNKEKIDIIVNKINILRPIDGNGGTEKAIKFGKMLKRTKIGIPFLIILDSDGDIDGKIKKMKDEKFNETDYFILPEKELKSYLINANAISKIVSVNPKEIQEKINGISGKGKEKLEKILKSFKLPCDVGIKVSIARNLDENPNDIKRLITLIKEKIS